MTRETLSWHPVYLQVYIYKCTFYNYRFLHIDFYKYSFSHLRIFTSAFLQVSIFTLVHIYKCPHLQLPFIYKGRFTRVAFSVQPLIYSPISPLYSGSNHRRQTPVKFYEHKKLRRDSTGRNSSRLDQTDRAIARPVETRREWGSRDVTTRQTGD